MRQRRTADRREPRKVQLRRETLRTLQLAHLTDDQLREVVGGGFEGCKYTCNGCS